MGFEEISENDAKRNIKKFVRQHSEITNYVIGPKAVGVKGDDREYGYSVILTLKPTVTGNNELISELSTKLTNEVLGITRVLVDI